jgi:hypothetical protein
MNQTGHPSDTHKADPGKDHGQGCPSGITRDARRAPLSVILLGSRPEHREDGCLSCSGARWR